MNRPRTPPVPVLPDLTGPPIETSSWRWSGADPEPSGRLTLPPAARRALIGTHLEGNAAAVVVVPATLFDAIGDRLLKRVQ